MGPTRKPKRPASNPRQPLAWAPPAPKGTWPAWEVVFAGTEYTTNPNPDQVAFARAAVNAGADLVVGHHPHWVQTIERYRGRYIFYSLGNFIFDQMFSAETRQGLAIKVTVTKPLSAVGLPDPSRGAKLAGIELVPLTIDNYSTPRLASSSEAAVLFSRIGEATTSLPELLK
jgi:poly-gamma-glutamate synthesis protein (capsule biosynthesis protein)